MKCLSMFFCDVSLARGALAFPSAEGQQGLGVHVFCTVGKASRHLHVIVCPLYFVSFNLRRNLLPISSYFFLFRRKLRVVLPLSRLWLSADVLPLLQIESLSLNAYCALYP